MWTFFKINYFSKFYVAADVALSVMMDRYGKYLGNGLDNFPRLKEINQTVNDLPGVKRYKENRPVSALEGTLE